jgi:hypothetical protein
MMTIRFRLLSISTFIILTQSINYTEHNDTHLNDTRHNDIQHKIRQCNSIQLFNVNVNQKIAGKTI